MVDVRDRFSRQLEQSGKLDRELEALPDADAVEERRRKGVGLTRPEFAVLLAYSKLTLYWSLVESDLPDDDDLAVELARYFPGRLADQFGDALRRHRLRREIIATQVTNAIMNRAGATFAFRMQEDTGAPEPDIARAYIAARELFAMPSFWDRVDELGYAVAPRVQIEMLLRARKLLERGTRWILRNRGRPLGITATIREFAEGVTTLAGALPGTLAGDDFDVWNARVAELTAADVPRKIAEREASFRPLLYGLDIIDVARDRGQPVLDVAALHFAVAARLRLDWIRERIADLPRDDRWSAMARAALRDDLYTLQRDLTADVLASGAGRGTAHQRIDAWVETRRAAVERALGMIDDIRSAGAYDLTTLPVAVRQVRAIIDMAARTSEERVEAS
jgi:glutamate dehydrogenase